MKKELSGTLKLEKGGSPTKSIKTKVQEIRNVHKIQGIKGTWDADDYMCGLFNGLELALAILEDRSLSIKN